MLQDLSEVIADVLPAEGIVTMAHDFFKEQPVKGKFEFSRLVSCGSASFDILSSKVDQYFLRSTRCSDILFETHSS